MLRKKKDTMMSQYICALVLILHLLVSQTFWDVLNIYTFLSINGLLKLQNREQHVSYLFWVSK